ncbi:MAG: hypothetical protein A2Y39_07045 [Candidatus Delongbacteria bacterium GWF2_40_14]|nr:MAG: hypothetical protein A2Y39_07045 [Candidatus Delongbacteria bacterium GWF2_40_14]
MKKIFVLVIVATLASLYAASFKGVGYSVIQRNSVPNIKVTIDIRLEKKVDKVFLNEFALYLKKNEKVKHKNMFICYYLPDMTVGAGAWATTHFNPNLDVRILGMTIEQESKFTPDKLNSDSEIIGRWKDESPLVGAFITIFKRNNQIFLSKKYIDGSKSEIEIIQKKQSGKIKYQEKLENRFGTYYLIEKNGDLSVYDNDGFITSAKVTK